MFEWQLSARVEECAGITASPSDIYTLVLRIDSKFSPPSDPAHVTANRLRFNSSLALNFATSTPDLPAQNLQVLLLLNGSVLSPRGISTRKEQIVAIATLRVAFPLPQQLTRVQSYDFDKGADTKSTLRASFSLTRTEGRQLSSKRSSHSLFSAQSQAARETVETLQLQQQSGDYNKSAMSLKPEKTSESARKSTKREKQEDIDQIRNERSELYKMSEHLYEELRRCMLERDEYLSELREKELSEEQTREELEFLKLKLEEYDQELHDNATLQAELEELRLENLQMKSQLRGKEVELKELERRVKESLIAIDEFRKEALQARTDLIHKESELSLISKPSKYLDPYECIEYLYQELENRRLEHTSHFYQEAEEYSESPRQKVASTLKRELALLFTQLMQRVKGQSDKEWLLHAKVSFERKIGALLNV